MFRQLTRTAAAVSLLASIPFTASALTVTSTGIAQSDANALAAAALSAGSGITIQSGSASIFGATGQQGTYSGFNLVGGGGQPTLTISDGVVLTTGTASFSTTTNTVNNFSVNSGTGSFAPLVALASTKGLSESQSNANVLSFNFVLDDTSLNAVTGKFIFATDEWPTQSVTDIMGIFVNGVNYAFFPNGSLVSNQSGSGFFNNNTVGTGNYGIEWNGLTNMFTFTALALGGGAVNTIEIAISDTSDTIFDSAVFFSGLTAGLTSGGGGIGPVDPQEPGVVPLPAGAWLLLGGLGGLAALRRRKRA
jgi:hypothetical protein